MTDSFDDDGGFELDFDGDDLARDGKGFSRVAEGSYHLQVAKVVEKTENSGDLMVEFEVIGGTNVAELGKMHTEYFNYPAPDQSEEANGTRKSLIRKLLYALKLTSKEECIELQKAGKRLKIDFSAAVGRQCCASIVHGKFTPENGKNKGVEQTKATFFKKGHYDSLWACDDPKAAGIPQNKNAAKKAGDASEAPFDDVDAILA